MKTKRIKITLPTISTRDEAEAVMNDLAMIATNERKLHAARDAKVLAINREFEVVLSQCATELQTKTEMLKNWAETNPDQFPKGRKSIEFLSGILGFRTGTLKLALVSRAWTWVKVLAKIKSVDRSSPFIRIKEEVDKETILAAHANHNIDDARLGQLGVCVTRDESFFIEPKLAEMDARQVSEAA
jgi:phage host-nuclease inhibitor protein Gam